MLCVKPITPKNIEKLATPYQQFMAVAQAEHGWPAPALPFDLFSSLFEQGLFQGYLLEEAMDDTAVGFLIFEAQASGVIEIRIVYLLPELNEKIAVDTLFKAFSKDLTENTHWKVVSFPMVGKALHDMTQYMPWYGLKPVGQAVMEFDLSDPITATVFQHLDFPKLETGFQIIPWDDQYKDQIAPLIYETFQNSVDSLWDPRLWDAQGAKEIIDFITQDQYGQFIPKASSLLLNEKQELIGFCFLSQIHPNEANIPLVGIKKAYRQKHYGRLLIAKTIAMATQLVATQQQFFTKITATCATENHAATRLYRHLGFKEAYWYPHCYVQQETFMNRKATISC